MESLKIIEKERIGIVSADFRGRAAEEAISWKGGKQEEKSFYSLYKFQNFEVLLGKPGKEAALEYNRCRHKDGRMGSNINDMTPTLKENGENHANKFSFDDVFRMLISIKDKMVLEVLGAVLFRMSYMLEYKVNEEGNIRLKNSKEVIDFFEEKQPLIKNIPILVFLQMIEVISLNEDVKYHTLGYNDQFKNATGKRNNILTYVRLIAVLLEREDFGSFIGSFARPPVGISPISSAIAYNCFPQLN